ncbi:hypothetical protein CI15_08765 [Paraburkholderia monticola]|uniref:Uncharacterized protein n=1 Tax=Paraburkholderia monticola TaxID=1399968 RepID=A0A149PVN8_9BURK|nr:hypothetical protein CI15_08765 [Paraburkholderia monticola]
MSTDALFAQFDGAQEFGFSLAGLEQRVTQAASILGFDARLIGDDIDLYRDGRLHFLCEGDSFDENTFCALDMLRWRLGSDTSVPAEFWPAIRLLALNRAADRDISGYRPSVTSCRRQPTQ